MPARVEPVSGAAVATFPWGAASAAVTAINEAVTTLGSQIDARPGMVTTLADWTGSYRREFDSAYSRISDTATGVKATLTTLASNIVAGAESANAAQRRFNDDALHPDPGSIPSGSRPV